MKTTTLCFLLKGEEVLLAMKKKGPRGFGVGKWNGAGGKVEEGESIEDAAVRETKEEIGVIVEVKNLVLMGSINFIYEGSPDWDQVMQIFVTRTWVGTPIESEEMRPQWFPQGSLPLQNMWADDPHWLPLVLNGKKIKAKFVFDAAGDTILRQDVEEAD